MSGRFDAAHVAAFFDQYGSAEWERLDTSPAGRVGFAVHTDLLAEFVRPGDLVLDAGAGPGRFTIELARSGRGCTLGTSRRASWSSTARSSLRRVTPMRSWPGR